MSRGELNAEEQIIDQVANFSLDDLRAQIDEVDEEIMFLLSKRFSLTEEIGSLKARIGLPEEDTAREAKQFKKLKRLANELTLPAGLEKELWLTIMQRVKERHAEIAS